MAEAQNIKQSSSNVVDSWFAHFTMSDGGDDEGPWSEGTVTIYPSRNAEYVGEGVQGMRHGEGVLSMFTKALPFLGLNPSEAQKEEYRIAREMSVVKARYEGGWQYDLPHGVGKMYDVDGSEYSGAWYMGEKRGVGQFRAVDGSVYRGEWWEDKREGKGREVMPDEDYVGHWSEGVRCGHGKCVSSDGIVYTGDWENGVMQGHGVLEGAGGSFVYEGEFEDGVPHGKGNCIYKGVVVEDDIPEEEAEEEGAEREGEGEGDGEGRGGGNAGGGGSATAGVMSVASSRLGTAKTMTSEATSVDFEGFAKEPESVRDALYKGEWKRGIKEGKGTMIYQVCTIDRRFVP